MTVRAINDPVYEYTCDLCGKTETGSWTPENWEGISIALFSGAMAQLHICQEYITDSPIVMLLNKVKTKVMVPSE